MHTKNPSFCCCPYPEPWAENTGSVIRLYKGQLVTAPGSVAFLALFLAIAISLSQPARAAGEAVEAKYKWVSVTGLSDGNYAASFNFIFTNTGTVDFYDLNVRLHKSLPVFLTDRDAMLAVGYLAVGETASVTQSLRFQMPVGGETRILFLGDAQEADGLGDAVAVVIEKEAVQ